MFRSQAREPLPDIPFGGEGGVGGMYSASESVFKEYKPFPCNNNFGPILVKKKILIIPLQLIEDFQDFCA